jgi:hypothetical protein
VRLTRPPRLGDQRQARREAIDDFQIAWTAPKMRHMFQTTRPAYQ